MQGVIERVLKMKEVKKPGQYYIERRYSDKSNSYNVTLTKENRKLNCMVYGRCYKCNKEYYKVFDYPGDFNLDVEHRVECDNDSCDCRMKFVNLNIHPDGVKDPKKLPEVNPDAAEIVHEKKTVVEQVVEDLQLKQINEKESEVKNEETKKEEPQSTNN